MANNNVFLNAYNGMARRGGAGDGFTGMLADARRMQFEVGMAQMQHQMGLERDAIQHAYNTDMAKTQGKQQRKTLKAQNAANMERDTHNSSLRTQEAREKVDLDNKRQRNENNNTLSYKRREGQLPLTRIQTYNAKQQRGRNEIELKVAETELEKAKIGLETSKEVSSRANRKMDIEEAQAARMGPYVDRVLGGITDSMGTPGAVGTFNQQSSSASRSTLPRYGGGGGGGGGSSKMPRKMRQKVQGKGLNPPK